MAGPWTIHETEIREWGPYEPVDKAHSRYDEPWRPMSVLPTLPESTNSAPLRRLDLDRQDSSRQQSDFINGLLASLPQIAELEGVIRQLEVEARLRQPPELRAEQPHADVFGQGVSSWVDPYAFGG